MVLYSSGDLTDVPKFLLTFKYQILLLVDTIGDFAFLLLTKAGEESENDSSVFLSQTEFHLPAFVEFPWEDASLLTLVVFLP